MSRRVTASSRLSPRSSPSREKLDNLIDDLSLANADRDEVVSSLDEELDLLEDKIKELESRKDELLQERDEIVDEQEKIDSLIEETEQLRSRNTPVNKVSSLEERASRILSRPSSRRPSSRGESLASNFKAANPAASRPLSPTPSQRSPSAKSSSPVRRGISVNEKEIQNYENEYEDISNTSVKNLTPEPVSREKSSVLSRNTRLPSSVSISTETMVSRRKSQVGTAVVSSPPPRNFSNIKAVSKPSCGCSLSK